MSSLYKSFPDTAEAELCLTVLLIRCFLVQSKSLLEPSRVNKLASCGLRVCFRCVASSCIEAA